MLAVWLLPFFVVVVVVRVAEVAREREEPSPKSLDLDENFKC